MAGQKRPILCMYSPTPPPPDLNKACGNAMDAHEAAQMHQNFSQQLLQDHIEACSLPEHNLITVWAQSRGDKVRVLGGSLGPARLTSSPRGTQFLRNEVHPWLLSPCISPTNPNPAWPQEPPWMGRRAPTQVGDAGCFLGALTSLRRATFQAQTCGPATPCSSLGRTSPVCSLSPQWTDGPPPVQFQAQNGPNTSLASLL